MTKSFGDKFQSQVTKLDHPDQLRRRAQSLPVQHHKRVTAHQDIHYSHSQGSQKTSLLTPGKEARLVKGPSFTNSQQSPVDKDNGTEHSCRRTSWRRFEKVLHRNSVVLSQDIQQGGTKSQRCSLSANIPRKWLRPHPLTLEMHSRQYELGRQQGTTSQRRFSQQRSLQNDFYPRLPGMRSVES